MAYAKKLRYANVQVTEKLYPKMIHGFFQMGGVIDQGREAIATIAIDRYDHNRVRAYWINDFKANEAPESGLRTCRVIQMLMKKGQTTFR
ncbi:hypothetical protein GCM10022209_21940 [Chitinophaga oryziterrae]